MRGTTLVLWMPIALKLSVFMKCPWGVSLDAFTIHPRCKS